MSDVSGTCVRLTYDLATLQGLDVHALWGGIDLPMPAALNRKSWVVWERFAALQDRLTEQLGGLEATVEAFRQINLISPDLSALLGPIVSPGTMYSFMHRVAFPPLWRCLNLTHQTLGPSTAELQVNLHEGRRPCVAYFWSIKGTIEAAPRFLGLPDAVVEAEITPVSGTYSIQMPQSQTFASRIRRAMLGPAELKSDDIQSAWPLPDLAALPEAERTARHLLAVRTWRLSERQSDVLKGLTEGESNKDLANRLNVSVKTIEAHITVLLQKGEVDSRLALVAAFWTLE